MTAAHPTRRHSPARHAARARRGGPWHGSLAVARLRLRTHRWGLLGWPAAMGALTWSTAVAITELYATDEARQAYAATIGNSTVSIAFNGLGHNLDRIGGIVVYELGAYALLVYPIIAMHLAIRHTRAEEEAGRDELLTAARVDLGAPLAAAALVTAGALGLGGLLSLGGLLAAGLPLAGSAAYVLALVLAMLACAGVGLVAAQVSDATRTAYSLALGVLALSYLARVTADGRGWNVAWANPAAWLPEVAPYGQARLWPYLAYGAAAVAFGGCATWLRARRDLGGGILAQRTGPPAASPRLGAPTGLAWRLSRGALLAWVVGAVLFGGGMGMLGPEMRAMVAANPSLAQYLGPSGADAIDLLLSLGTILSALLACCVGVVGASRLASEEASARAGLLLSTPLRRGHWLAAHALVTLVHLAAVLLAGGAATGAALAWSLGEPAMLGRGVGAAVCYLPAAALTAAVSAVGWSLRPVLAQVGWAVVAWASVVALLGDTLRLPQWSRDLSPLHHAGRVPLDPVSFGALAGTGAAVAALATVAWLRFRSRDLAAG